MVTDTLHYGIMNECVQLYMYIKTEGYLDVNLCNMRT